MIYRGSTASFVSIKLCQICAFFLYIGKVEENLPIYITMSDDFNLYVTFILSSQFFFIYPSNQQIILNQHKLEDVDKKYLICVLVIGINFFPLYKHRKTIQTWNSHSRTKKTIKAALSNIGKNYRNIEEVSKNFLKKKNSIYIYFFKHHTNHTHSCRSAKI